MKYLGKTITGEDTIIAVKLNISKADVARLRNNPTRYLINESTGVIEKINLSESPLLLRKFGVKRGNNKLIKGGRIRKNIVVSKDPFLLSKPITGRVECNIRVLWYNDNFWDVPDSYLPVIDANNKILINEETVRNNLVHKFLEENPSIARDVDMGLATVHVNNLEFITKNMVSLEFNDMRLRGVGLDIRRIYGESVDLNKTNDNNCVKNYLLKNYPISSKVINKLGNADGITPKELHDFCSKYRIF
jgi:hypothetical protein